MTSFYGFDFKNNPNYSRLFSPDIMNKAQGAYGQGMSMWKPQDQEQIDRMRQGTLGRQQQQPAAPVAAQPDQKAQMLDSLKAQYMSLLESGRSQGSMIPVQAQLEALKRAMQLYGYGSNYTVF